MLSTVLFNKSRLMFLSVNIHVHSSFRTVRTEWSWLCGSCFEKTFFSFFCSRLLLTLA